MKILIVIDGGDPYFMEYVMTPATADELALSITGMWEFCPGCLAEMMDSPEVYLATHLVEHDRATEIISRNLAAIYDMVMPL